MNADKYDGTQMTQMKRIDTDKYNRTQINADEYDGTRMTQMERMSADFDLINLKESA